MPNGGYPIYFMAVLPESGFAIQAYGKNVQLVRLLSRDSGIDEPETKSAERLGEFSTDQICALLYHLRYWGGAHAFTEGKRRETFDYELIGPRYHSTGCIYDY